MSDHYKRYDIFLSHSGAQKNVINHQLNDELKQYGSYKVFFDRESIPYSDQIPSTILWHASMCKYVAVLSEYFTRSKSPMMELDTSYTAAKERSHGRPRLLIPIFWQSNLKMRKIAKDKGIG